MVEAELDEEPDLSLEKKQALYRIAQEAFHNIVKHARARLVVFRLAEREDEIHLEIQDDGRGFDPTGSFPGHLGLRSMQERITKAGGTLTIDSTPGQGTHLLVRLPRRDCKSVGSMRGKL
jgi:signal transduction histidine kinase